MFVHAVGWRGAEGEAPWLGDATVTVHRIGTAHGDVVAGIVLIDSRDD